MNQREKTRGLKGWILRSIMHTLRALGYGIAGAFAVLIIVYIIILENRPALKVWHTAMLDAEYTAKSQVDSFQDYLILEDRLFTQLAKRVHARIPPEDRSLINRYHRGSLSDPSRWSPNWNRTFELTQSHSRGGVLLLHGMSDSPYSLRSLGAELHKAGFWVVGLRLPGHGTAPSGLVSTRWQDMAAAAKLALHHVKAKIGDAPLYILGYSTGGALAVNYVLDSLEDSSLPGVERLVLISAAIGVTPFAALAVWQARLGHWLGLGKLAWKSILPEYDPFKYNSFAVNAGDQVHRLSKAIQSRIASMRASGLLKDFPPVLAFQSVVDATVSVQAVIDGLFGQLPDRGHELLLFDIRRRAEIERLLAGDPREKIATRLKAAGRSFTVSWVTNANEHSDVLVQRRRYPAGDQMIETSLPYSWPDDIYSLSHVALPFSPEDPVYGGSNAQTSPGIYLGKGTLRGESNVLQISPAAIMRLRYNPFYAFLEEYTLNYLIYPHSSQSR